MTHRVSLYWAMFLTVLVAPSLQATLITVEKASPALATTFVFPTVPSNSSTDFANGRPFILLDGLQSGSGLANLTDGVGQIDSDEPADSFFARDASNVRIQIDLGNTYPIDQINTYSWHTGVRAHQFYQLYGATAPSNNAPNFTDAAFRDDTALGVLGYTLIDSVDTRSLAGGQHGVSINGAIGNHRYLLFEISQANTTDGTNGSRGTFFGEIDVYVIPEPSSLALLGGAALALLTWSRRKR